MLREQIQGFQKPFKKHKDFYVQKLLLTLTPQNLCIIAPASNTAAVLSKKRRSSGEALSTASVSSFMYQYT